MAARTILGIVLSIFGLALVVNAAYNFNTLFFVQRMLTTGNIPSYDANVVLPLLLGFIVLIDGSITLGLKRRMSLILHAIGNLALFWAVYLLYVNLAIPVLQVSPYQPVFYSVVAGMVLFVVGFIINDIPHHKPKPKGVEKSEQKSAAQPDATTGSISRPEVSSSG